MFCCKAPHTFDRLRHSRSPSCRRPRSPDQTRTSKNQEKPFAENTWETGDLGGLLEERPQNSIEEEEMEEEEEAKTAWVRSAPADLYYQRDEK